MKRNALLVAGLVLLVQSAWTFGNAGKARMAQVDKMLRQVALYDWGRSRTALSAFSDTLRSFYPNAELLAAAQERMLGMLKADATRASKQYLCQELSLMGDEKAVPVLSSMLKDSVTFDMAMYALERIPSPAVDGALTDRLPKSEAREKIGLVNALGNRAAARAVPALTDLLMDRDEDVGLAAAAALGKIGGPGALAALEKVRPMAIGDMQLQIGESMAVCAEKMVRAGDRAGAMKVYSVLMTPQEPLPIQQAALIGMVEADPAASMDMLVGTLQTGNPAMQSSAIALIRNVRNADVLKRIASRLFELSSLHQAQLLSAFADMNRKQEVLPAVLDAARRGDDAVRVAALKAVATLGDSSCVTLLSEKAASGTADEKTAARESLARLSGPGVDDAILTAIPKAETPEKIELIRSLPPRVLSAGAETLFGALDSQDLRVRIEAYRALSEIAVPDQLPRLVERLASASTDADRREAVKTVTAVGLKISDQDKRGQALLDRFQSSSAVPAKAAFLEALGKLGDPHALPVIRKCLADRNEEVQSAAVLALSDWPNDEPMGDLFEIAKTSKNETLRVLGLRGAIKLTESAVKSQDEALRLYLNALSLCTGVPEKQAVFSGVAKIASTKALDTALMSVADTEIGNEAEAAAIQIIRNIREKHPDEANDGLKKLLAAAKNPSVRQEAEELAKDMQGK
jgi:HEAT repeat protein